MRFDLTNAAIARFFCTCKMIMNHQKHACDICKVDFRGPENTISQLFKELDEFSSRWDEIWFWSEFTEKFEDLCKAIKHRAEKIAMYHPLFAPRLASIQLFDELNHCCVLHKQILYPFMRLEDHSEHSFFDGSVYTITDILKDSIDTLKASIFLRQWTAQPSDCQASIAFQNVMDRFVKLVDRVMDIHLHTIYPKAITLEDGVY